MAALCSQFEACPILCRTRCAEDYAHLRAANNSVRSLFDLCSARAGDSAQEEHGSRAIVLLSKASAPTPRKANGSSGQRHGGRTVRHGSVDSAMLCHARTDSASSLAPGGENSERLPPLSCVASSLLETPTVSWSYSGLLMALLALPALSDTHAQNRAA